MGFAEGDNSLLIAVVQDPFWYSPYTNFGTRLGWL